MRETPFPLDLREFSLPPPPPPGCSPVARDVAHPEPQRVSRLPPLGAASPPPSAQVVHKQFNSPIGLYSDQNIAETIQSQTGATPNQLEKANANHLNQSQIPDRASKFGSLKYKANTLASVQLDLLRTDNQTHSSLPSHWGQTNPGPTPQSQEAFSPNIHVGPAKSSPCEASRELIAFFQYITHFTSLKKTYVYDPSKSETFKALKESEFGEEVQEMSQPVQPKVFTPQVNKNVHFKVNSLGNTADNIQQSGSFRRLMNAVLGESEY
ncbi:Uncharacterized protein GBIM_13632 [Gryllus bimaculatus]|nr:Uncharacterized protein GBIM_13632 [Gryllus bimaculatus]